MRLLPRPAVTSPVAIGLLMAALAGCGSGTTTGPAAGPDRPRTGAAARPAGGQKVVELTRQCNRRRSFRPLRRAW